MQTPSPPKPWEIQPSQSNPPPYQPLPIITQQPAQLSSSTVLPPNSSILPNNMINNPTVVGAAYPSNTTPFISNTNSSYLSSSSTGISSLPTNSTLFNNYPNSNPSSIMYPSSSTSINPLAPSSYASYDSSYIGSTSIFNPTNSSYGYTQPPVASSYYSLPSYPSSAYPSSYPSTLSYYAPNFNNGGMPNYYGVSPFINSLQNLQSIIYNIGGLFDSLGGNITTLSHTIHSGFQFLTIIGQMSGELLGIIRNPHPTDPRIRKYQITRFAIGSTVLMVVYYVLQKIFRRKRSPLSLLPSDANVHAALPLVATSGGRNISGSNRSNRMNLLFHTLLLISGWIGGYRFAQHNNSNVEEQEGENNTVRIRMNNNTNTR